MPTHLRPSLSAATQAVAQPQKGSRTMSPSLLLALMMRSSRARAILSRLLLASKNANDPAVRTLGWGRGIAGFWLMKSGGTASSPTSLK